MSDENDKQFTELDWIQLNKDVHAGGNHAETTKEKMMRKIQSNPFVPIGEVKIYILTIADLYFLLDGIKDAWRHYVLFLMDYGVSGRDKDKCLST